MPDTIEGDSLEPTPGSAPETPAVTEPTDSAISQPTEPVAPVAADDDKPVGVEPPDATDSKTAIEFLTKGVEKPKSSEKPKAPETPAAKPEDKKPEDKIEPKAEKSLDDDPLHDYSETDRKRLSERTHTRVKDLHRNWKQAQSELEKVKPLVEQGEAFSSVLDEYKVREDLPYLGDNGDAAIAGAIKFHAAINRIGSGNGTAMDKQVVEAVFKSLDSVRSSIGVAPVAPVVSAEDLDAAFTAIKDEADYTKMEALVAKLKAPAPQPAPVQAPASQAVPTQQPTAPVENPDLDLYNGLLIADIEASGVGKADISNYFASKVMPAVLANLKSRFPNRDPEKLFNSLSPKAQYDLATREHAKVQESLRPPKAPAKPPTVQTPRPVSTTGTQPVAKEPPTVGAKAAIDFLTD